MLFLTEQEEFEVLEGSLRGKNEEEKEGYNTEWRSEDAASSGSARDESSSDRSPEVL